ncbi:Phosphopantetheine adenylyltransferase [Trichinella spiralis]|uniref:Phosphopantetheine adenylyltransferase n=1 Tax=Trichinella spiralis TaxID=6334 RepID=A0ABR3K6H9_TRISP
MKYILTFLLCILKSIEIGHSVRCGWTPNRMFEAAIKEKSFLNISVATLPWIHVLTDMSTRTKELAATPVLSLSADSHLIQKAKEAPQVIFDEGQRGPVNFIPVVAAFWNTKGPKKNHYILFMRNPVIYSNNIRPICFVQSSTRLQTYLSVWYCGGSLLYTQRICVRNLTLLDPSDCSDAIPSNVSRACFQDNYEKNSEIFGQVVMASDGTYWYLFAFFDRALPNVPDKPQNRTMFKLFEKHHLLRFAPRFNRSHEI